jgi:D-alanyl-D-alanine dipeptidase
MISGTFCVTCCGVFTTSCCGGAIVLLWQEQITHSKTMMQGKNRLYGSRAGKIACFKALVFNFINNNSSMVDKIVNRINIQTIIISIFFSALYPVQAQNLKVLKKYSEYKRTVKADSLKKMIELKEISPTIQYDLRYATTNNFMHQKLYKTGNQTFLRLPAAKALAKIQQELNEKNLSLKIWDAYRPYNITKKMWELIKDDRYVADPKKGSGHNRGIAVDITLINKSSGEELNMGTGFDNFFDTAHADFKNLPDDILQNRLLLKSVMEKYGFKELETEWWHFSWNNSDFELLDIDNKNFKKKK